jgi:hypothetical protein
MKRLIGSEARLPPLGLIATLANPTDDDTVSLVVFFAGHEHDE